MLHIHVQLIMPDMWCTGAGSGGTPPYFSDDVTTVPQSPGFERLLRPFWSECVQRLLTQFATEICCSLLELLPILGSL